MKKNSEELILEIARSTINSESPLPVNLSQNEEVPFVTFNELLESIRQNRIILARYSINYDADIYDMLASKSERFFQSFWLITAPIIPIACIILAFIDSFWWLAGTPYFLYALRKSKKLYNQVILSSALKSELSFCFLFATRQISLSTPDFMNSFYWNQRTNRNNSAKNEKNKINEIISTPEQYHSKIEKMVEETHQLLLEKFPTANPPNFDLRTISAFIVNAGTIIAAKNSFPELRDVDINGFIRGLSFYTPNTTPDTKNPENTFVSYPSLEESFMYDQLEILDLEGEDFLINIILRELNNHSLEKFSQLKEIIEKIELEASKSFLPFLVRLQSI